MKVAIIGAGFSGMLAAYLLEKNGLKVTVYEKEEYIGGHCRTFANKDLYAELGTVFSFPKEIKELLIELKVDYTERFVYRNFVDENFNSVEHMPREDVVLLMDELARLTVLLKQYSSSLNDVNYGYIHEDLLVPLHQFLKKHDLKIICQVIAPHLSSYGYGNILNTQAYYTFKIFSLDIILSFIRGDKLLFINSGTSDLINKLSQNISDIRYSIEVNNVELIDNKVKVETNFSSDYYDKVLITTKLPRDVIKDDLYNHLMKKIDTNPFITCAYEVSNSKLVTTYFKANLGKKGKIQFFHTFKKNNRIILIAYAYGTIQKDLVNGITHDIQSLGININHLITAKQWYIFPHLKENNLTQNFYQDISERQKISNICLIGSLVSQPSLSNLYLSVKNSVNQILDDYNSNK
ncbi:FAD-dependent oxidoreductase [Clostridium grantii]|uniref:NAD(P)-binding Rossmann-like domain-containing protein n=1 Tax=Clostridium grantii DSM 8605 TaxID=1121316 RepID=A0A1M5TNT3_9CLOT|nr:FAD-dependent oxidoreductase [Clostridium grantii]SHH52475.1 NAD(P)-binding Rossmann-like domain-containing protein [Clostridium grantii DSM 8605]